MYTLRTIHKGGLEVNTSLGQQYFIADRHRNGGIDFKLMWDKHHGDEKIAIDPQCVAMIRDDRGNLNAIWSYNDNYIMTDSGSTFSRINRAE